MDIAQKILCTQIMGLDCNWYQALANCVAIFINKTLNIFVMGTVAHHRKLEEIYNPGTIMT